MSNETLTYCEFILRLYFFSGSFSAEVDEHFQEWLTNGEFCREKEIAMRRIFYEFLDDLPPAIPYDKDLNY